MVLLMMLAGFGGEEGIQFKLCGSTVEFICRMPCRLTATAWVKALALDQPY